MALGERVMCEPLAEVIMAKAEVGLSAQRIYQDLVGENARVSSLAKRMISSSTPEGISALFSKYRTTVMQVGCNCPWSFSTVNNPYGKKILKGC